NFLDFPDFYDLHEPPSHAALPLDNAALDRIKTRTWHELGIHPHAQSSDSVQKKPATPRRRYHKRAFAAAILLVLLGAAIGLSEEVRAELKKILQFLPGFGTVSEGNGHPVYVLEKPVSAEARGSEWKVDGIMIGEQEASIRLRGTGGHAPDKITLSTGQSDKERYEFKHGTFTSSSNGWKASYTYRGAIPFSGHEAVFVELPVAVIGPLPLVLAKQAGNLDGLGPTAAKNGVTITAVTTPMAQKRIRVNLLSILPDGLELDSFGIDPLNKSEETRLKLTNERGGNLEIQKDSIFANQNEFFFTGSPQDLERYRLSIPYIRVADKHAPQQQVTVPVPLQEGSANIDQTVLLAGFPVDFTKVERVDSETVRVHVNVRFDSGLAKTLQSFKVYTQNADRMSYMWKAAEDTGAIEYLELEVQPGMEELTFSIGEPRYLLKGPWQMVIE
ncbi:hypothetical protein, partial [Brevibacillus borstelensis]